MGLRKKSKEQQSRELGFYFDAGLQFGLSIIIGFLAGWWIDKKTGYTPLFSVDRHGIRRRFRIL